MIRIHTYQEYSRASFCLPVRDSRGSGHRKGRSIGRSDEIIYHRDRPNQTIYSVYSVERIECEKRSQTIKSRQPHRVHLHLSHSSNTRSTTLHSPSPYSLFLSSFNTSPLLSLLSISSSPYSPCHSPCSNRGLHSFMSPPHSLPPDPFPSPPHGDSYGGVCPGETAGHDESTRSSAASARP
jgi:hypothetical protein